MKPTDARHYMAIQTVLGVVSNVAINAIIAAVTPDVHKTDATSLHSLVFVAAPQLFLAAFLSALGPCLFTRRRYAKGELLPPLERSPPGWLRIVEISALLGLLSALFGMILVDAILYLIAPSGLSASMRVLFNGGCGGLVSAFAIRLALRLSFRTAVGP